MEVTKVFSVLDREISGAVLWNRVENTCDEVSKAGTKTYDEAQAVASNDVVALMPHAFSTGGSASADVETAPTSQVAWVPKVN